MAMVAGRKALVVEPDDSLRPSVSELASTRGILNHGESHCLEIQHGRGGRAGVCQIAGLTEGTPVHFAWNTHTSEVTLDKVEDAFKDEKIELIQSNLSKEQEARLREHFGAEA